MPPCCRANAAGEPCSTSRPALSTSSWSQSMIVSMRCAMTSSVLLRGPRQHLSYAYVPKQCEQFSSLQSLRWSERRSATHNPHAHSAARAIMQRFESAPVLANLIATRCTPECSLDGSVSRPVDICSGLVQCQHSCFL